MNFSNKTSPLGLVLLLSKEENENDSREKSHGNVSPHMPPSARFPIPPRFKDGTLQ